MHGSVGRRLRLQLAALHGHPHRSISLSSTTAGPSDSAAAAAAAAGAAGELQAVTRGGHWWGVGGVETPPASPLDPSGLLRPPSGP